MLHKYGELLNSRNPALDPSELSKVGFVRDKDKTRLAIVGLKERVS